MGWTAPLTAVTNTMLSAGQWNASVRDNLEETTPAVATVGRRIFVTDGDNKIAERDIKDHIVDAKEETTSTSYTDLDTLGPIITIETGQAALVWICSHMSNTGSTNSLHSYAVSGETTIATDDNKARDVDGGDGGFGDRCTVTNLDATNPGTNIFTSKYKVTGGTGTFQKRRLIVMGL